MSGTQLTLIQIDNYGPWTVSPGPRAEPDLQALQARLFADISQFVNTHRGYVFFTRFDNMIAVTNGMESTDYRRLQESIGNRYPVSISLCSARDPSPATALARATAELQAAGSAQDGARREVLTIVDGPADSHRAQDVTVAHFDVIDATTRYTDQVTAYESFMEINQAFDSLMRHLYREHDGLAFFVGGDNAIAICPDLPAEAYRSTIDHVREETGVPLQVGVGSGRRAGDAGMEAKHALERCRAEANPVHLASAKTRTGD